MKELFFQFVQAPTRENYMAVREAILDAEEYAPYSENLDRCHELLEEEDWQQIKECLQSDMPNLLLSPQAHLILSMVAEQQGDKQVAEMESVFATACAEGILETGSGTQEEPFIVLRTTDEYDVVNILQKEFATQSLIHDEENDRVLDLITCEDGSELWFDITDPYYRLQEMLGDEDEEMDEEWDDEESDTEGPARR